METLRARLAEDRAARRFVNTVLERRDQLGHLPATVAYACASDEEDALRSFVPPDCMRPREGGRVLIRLGALDRRLRDQGELGLAEALAAAARRQPRDLPAERTQLQQAVSAQIDATAQEDDPAPLVAWLARARELTQRGRGDWIKLAHEQGPAAGGAELALVAGALREAWSRDPHSPVRLENLSRRVAGSTKALRPGTSAFERMADALVGFDAKVRSAVDAARPGSLLARRRLALEARGILLNSLNAEVTIHGPFTYFLGGRQVDAPAVHATAGLPYKLPLAVLREACPGSSPARTVTTVENEAAFHDYAEWVRREGKDELVVFIGGQASYAAIALLELVAASEGPAPRAFQHFGDLDRWGVLILRSLRNRTGLDIRPLFMDPAILEKHLDTAQPLPPGEIEQITSLLCSTDAPQICDDLLLALRNHGRWLEQEAIAESLLRFP